MTPRAHSSALRIRLPALPSTAAPTLPEIDALDALDFTPAPPLCECFHGAPGAPQPAEGAPPAAWYVVMTCGCLTPACEACAGRVVRYDRLADSGLGHMKCRICHADPVRLARVEPIR